MPIKAYVGMPRSGKSYEVVSKVIIPAIAQGRRVVSNIAGLNYDEICQLLYAEGFHQDQLGQLITVDHSEVEKPEFWRTDTDQENGIEAFIQPGDLLALDEIWRFWKKRGDIHTRAMNFFRMHGHFSHPVTGYTCEVALITQSIRDINENIRDVVQETFRTVKNTKLGSDKSYIVHVYQSGSVTKSNLIRTLPPRLYDAKYYPCYKSHSQRNDGDAEAKEKNPDDRANILKGAIFKIGFPIAIVFFLLGIWGVMKFLSPKKEPEKISSSAPVSSNSVQHRKPEIDLAESWRVLGWYKVENNLTITVKSSSGVIRVLQNPPRFKLTSMTAEVELPEGGFATPWTGGESKGGLIQ